MLTYCVAVAGCSPQGQTESDTTEATTQRQKRALDNVSITVLFTQLSAGLNLGAVLPL